jgi:hypothetical protein
VRAEPDSTIEPDNERKRPRPPIQPLSIDFKPAGGFIDADELVFGCSFGQTRHRGGEACVRGGQQTQQRDGFIARCRARTRGKLIEGDHSARRSSSQRTISLSRQAIFARPILIGAGNIPACRHRQSVARLGFPTRSVTSLKVSIVSHVSFAFDVFMVFTMRNPPRAISGGFAEVVLSVRKKIFMISRSGRFLARVLK